MVTNTDTTKYKNLLSILPHKKIGKAGLEDRHDVYGIYQRYHVKGKVKSRKLNFYEYVITRTEAQQAQRARYKAGFEAWRLLTNEQKQVYNKRAVNYKISGYNLFMKENIHG